MEFTRVEKKLRQAAFFLRYLGSIGMPGRTEETMEFYLSACLTAAQSVYYVLGDEASRRRVRCQREEYRWSQTVPAVDFDFFKYMKDVRDDDVHRALVPATSLNKFMDSQIVHGVTIVTTPPGGFPTVEEKDNPDGTKARGWSLAPVPTLYMEYSGQHIEASSACGRFIDLLEGLVMHFRNVTRGEST